MLLPPKYCRKINIVAVNATWLLFLRREVFKKMPNSPDYPGNHYVAKDIFSLNSVQVLLHLHLLNPGIIGCDTRFSLPLILELHIEGII